jgi:AraC-like DNA-binding protein
MMIHAVATILQGWKGDLVETRRALRGPFLLVVSVYILLLRGFEIWDIFGDPPAWYPMANAGVLAAVCLAGSFVFLESRSDLFGIVRPPESVPNPAARQMAQLSVSTAAVANGHATAPVAANGSGTTVVALDRAEKADLERLECLMAKEEVWREEGLTIASLAHRAQMPEAQLRHLINDRLGYRNFPSYVNAHRIACAKNRLSDPNEARISISTIAYDIGFASLGPFNRAFRDVTGVSPSEWRKTALHEPSPISESA